MSIVVPTHRWEHRIPKRLHYSLKVILLIKVIEFEWKFSQNSCTFKPLSWSYSYHHVSLTDVPGFYDSMSQIRAQTLIIWFSPSHVFHWLVKILLVASNRNSILIVLSREGSLLSHIIERWGIFESRHSFIQGVQGRLSRICPFLCMVITFIHIALFLS